jgi:hypothetical protein
LQASTLIKTGTNTLTLATGAAAATVWTIPINAVGVLTNDGAGTLSWGAGGGGAPGGLDTYVQYNKGGVFGGNVAFTFDDGTGVVTHAGDIYFADNAAATPRQILVNAQTTADTLGNQLVFRAGNGDGTGSGGMMIAKAGKGGATGNGGNLGFEGGTGGATSGNGGDAEFAGGNAATSGNGGNLNFYPGAGAGGGTNGHVKLYENISGFFAIFDTSILATSDKTFTFPNVSGSFALGAGTLTNATGNDVTVAAHTHAITGTFPASAHNVLDSTYHGDVLTGSILRGDILYGNVTPKIARLALGGITGSVLTRDATDVLWSAGALSFAGAFTLTVPATGTTALLGTANVFTATQSVPTSSGTAVFSLDASGGSSISLITNATATPTGNALNFAGLVIINDTTIDGTVAIFCCGGAVAQLIGGDTALYSGTKDTASKVNMYYTAGVLYIQNKTAGTRVYNVMTLRSRNSS